MASSPPMYMQLDSRTMNITGVTVPQFLTDAHGFCMDIVTGTAAPTPVVCGGSSNGNYTAQCWKLGLGTSSSVFTSISAPQDGCTLLAYGTKFVVFPGYLASYLAPGSILPPTTNPNPDMTSFDMSTGAWTTVSNLPLTLALSNRAFSIATIMPDTETAVIFGGYSIQGAQGNTDLNLFGMAANSWLTGVSPASAAFVQPNTNGTGDANDGKSSKSAIVGGAVGGLVVVLLIVIAFLLYKRRQKRTYRYSGANDPNQIELEESNRIVDPAESKRAVEDMTSTHSSWDGKSQVARSPQANRQPSSFGPQAIYRKAPQTINS